MGTIDKKTYRDLGDAVGMPDEMDKKHVQKILLRYEKEHPGEIAQIIRFAQANSAAAANPFGRVTAASGKGIDSNSGRYIMELPQELHQKLEEYIPTLFRNKRHFSWFCKEFKSLVLPEKY